ncbi:hypothetical protein GNY06_04040 [Elizabethkingia argentiflava]|uniref:Uncharacterized protein n=1 Tax=Elizabethkingia argenteiflava TaxID=2681556 RepID=A0A845PW96_9FLAO|nr:hypothetical protein [Elizabethkingia argenteiflava]NAW50588.1 hypothetical protein [Elizabethkingia argenteiflava]
MNKEYIVLKLEDFIQNAKNHSWIELSLIATLIKKYLLKLDSSDYKVIGEFSENSFELEIQTNSSEILFIDLSLTFLDVRFNYFENNFFIDEFEDIEKYFENFFQGDYEVVSFYDRMSKKVYKTRVLWKSADMSKYNKEYTYKSIKDFFTKEKYLIENTKSGYKWKLSNNM